MEESKLKINMSTYRRLKIQHKMNENRLERKHLANLKFYKYQEEMFNRKIDHLRKSLEHIQPYIDDQQILRSPICFSRIKTHVHLLNISPQTQKPHSSEPPIYNKPNKQISNHLRNIPHKANSNEEKCFQTLLNQKISDEHRKQLKHHERKDLLLKEFDELKHSINDPHSTLSVLAALSRALLFFDSIKK